MHKAVILQNTQEPSQHLLHIVPVVVLEVMRTINRVELSCVKGCEVSRIAHNVWRASRVDIKQQVFKPVVLRGQRDFLTMTPNI